MYHPMHMSPRKKHFLGFDDDDKDCSSEDSGVDKACGAEVIIKPLLQIIIAEVFLNFLKFNFECFRHFNVIIL